VDSNFQFRREIVSGFEASAELGPIVVATMSRSCGPEVVLTPATYKGDASILSSTRNWSTLWNVFGVTPDGLSVVSFWFQPVLALS
jgi:hypothetical protein